jgi:hypothetical protein
MSKRRAMRLMATITITGPSHNPMQMAANTAVFKTLASFSVARRPHALASAPRATRTAQPGANKQPDDCRNHG